MLLNFAVSERTVSVGSGQRDTAGIEFVRKGPDGVVEALVCSSMITANSKGSWLTSSLHVGRPRKCLSLIPGFVGNSRVVVASVVRLQLISVSATATNVKKAIRTAPPASMIHVNFAEYCRATGYVKNEDVAISDMRTSITLHPVESGYCPKAIVTRATRRKSTGKTLRRNC